MNIQRIVFWDLKNPINESKLQFEEGIGPYKLAQIAKLKGVKSIVYQDHLFDANIDKIVKEIKREYESNNNIAFAFSVLSSGVDLLLEILKRVIDLKAPIMIGGAGATVEPERIMKEASIIVPREIPLVLTEGEGEDVFRELLSTPAQDWVKLTRLWRRGINNEVLEGTYQLCNIEESPVPDLGGSYQRQYFTDMAAQEDVPFLDRYKYLRALTNSQFEVGKGCYFRCGFCNTSCLKYQQIRKKSPERVVREMIYLFHKYGITFFGFTDNIAFDKAAYWDKFYKLLNSCPEKNFIFFGGYSAPYLLAKPEWLNNVLPKLYSIGLRSIIIGVQAGSKRILKEIIKRPPTDPEKAIKIIKAGVDLGINVKIDFIIGHPTETIADLKNTYRLMKILLEMGGELFVRKLKVVPHSHYDLMLKSGKYTLPEEADKWNFWTNKIFTLKRDDSKYRRSVLSSPVIPNKYLINREENILYPHEVFNVEMLKANLRKLQDSLMDGKYRKIYEQMFKMMIKYKTHQLF